MSKSYAQVCPIARTLDLIGQRWTLLILRDLFFGRSKFKELMRSSPGMPTRILSERLKMLEAAGIIERQIYSEHPIRAEYHLTAEGTSLAPVLSAISGWGITHRFDPGAQRAVRAKIDRHLRGGDKVPAAERRRLTGIA